MAKGVLIVNTDEELPGTLQDALEVVQAQGLHPENEDGELTYDSGSGIISVDGKSLIRINRRRIIPFFAGSSLWGKPTSEPE